MSVICSSPAKTEACLLKQLQLVHYSVFLSELNKSISEVEKCVEEVRNNIVLIPTAHAIQSAYTILQNSE
jgi:hypothetical protein